MRNVRSALVAAVVGLSLTTACSFSSSRSWGSAATPNSGTNGKGKPALHQSKGRPAQKTPTPVATPKPAPAPAPAPAVEPPVEAKPPARVPRDETPTSGATGKTGTTLGANPTQPPQPVQPIDGGAAKKPGPKGLSISPAKPDPQPKGIKAAPNN